MEKFIKEIQLRWSDLDPNFHLRHSVYYDWGAFCRIEFLKAFDLTTKLMQELQFGPILFREECIFKREIRDGDKITIDITLLKSRRDFSRWSIRHNIIKNGDILSAILTVDGAWINTKERKLAVPPPQAEKVFSQMPLDENFQWTDH
ncbi:MAG TPA: acyl-CoA thioesterase [Chitinophagaceae bacterium]|nr:acyl-CoA thioesterase [Chitinophagaceae bacterium]